MKTCFYLKQCYFELVYEGEEAEWAWQTQELPHLPVRPSHCTSYYTCCGYFMGIYMDAFSSSIFTFGLKPTWPADPHFFICKSRQLPLLSQAQINFWSDGELGHGWALPCEPYECKMLVYHVTLPALSFSLVFGKTSAPQSMGVWEPPGGTCRCQEFSLNG